MEAGCTLLRGSLLAMWHGTRATTTGGRHATLDRACMHPVARGGNTLVQCAPSAQAAWNAASGATRSGRAKKARGSRRVWWCSRSALCTSTMLAAGTMRKRSVAADLWLAARERPRVLRPLVAAGPACSWCSRLPGAMRAAIGTILSLMGKGWSMRRPASADGGAGDAPRRSCCCRCCCALLPALPAAAPHRLGAAAPRGAALAERLAEADRLALALHLPVTRSRTGTMAVPQQTSFSTCRHSRGSVLRGSTTLQGRQAQLDPHTSLM